MLCGTFWPAVIGISSLGLGMIWLMAKIQQCPARENGAWCSWDGECPPDCDGSQSKKCHFCERTIWCNHEKDGFLFDD